MFNTSRDSKRLGKLNAVKACLLGATAIASFSLTPALAQGNSPITFEEIFANPGDKQLNIDYAKQEAKAGNLLASAATLERLLLDDPAWDDARLFYAAVLYRLGDFQGAEREIRLLEARPLSPDLKAQLQEVKARVRGQLSKSTLSGSVALGIAYDDNVAVNQNDLDIIGATDTNDYALTARLRAKYTYDIGGENDLKFFAMGSTYSKLYEEFGQVDFNFLAGRVGLEGARGPVDWVASLDVKNLDIAGDQYLREYGLDVRVRRELTPTTSLQFDGDHSRGHYDNIVIGSSPTLIEDLRTGFKTTGIVSVNHKFAPGVKGSVGVGLQRKTAGFDAYAYDTSLVTATGSKSFGNGTYAIASYFFRNVEYDAVDATVPTAGPDPRKEDRHYIRGAVGMPLGAVFETQNDNLQRSLDNIYIEAAVFHDERQANAEVYDYENTGAEVKVSWRFKQ